MKKGILFLATYLFLTNIYVWAQEESTSITDLDHLQSAPEWEKDTTLNYLDPDSTWWSSMQLGINFNQSSFSENWTGGGVSSFALGSFSNYQLHYLQDPWSWNNQVEFIYGIFRNADQDYIRKSQDRIFIDSKLGYKISEFWNAFFSINFLTQFAPGYRYVEDTQGNEARLQISQFMAPAFLTTSFGLEYRPVDYFWLRLSPYAPRLTFVTNENLYANMEDGKNYGVPVGNTTRREWLASQVLAELNKKLTENIHLQSRYMLFANYEQFSFNSIDHRLDILFNAKLTRFINFSIGTIMLYDINQDNNIQISQSMGIGLLFQK